MLPPTCKIKGNLASLSLKMRETTKMGCKTYSGMQDYNSKDEHKYQSHDNEESVESTIMSRRSKPMEEKSREEECCQVTYKRNNEQRSIPIYIET